MCVWAYTNAPTSIYTNPFVHLLIPALHRYNLNLNKALDGLQNDLMMGEFFIGEIKRERLRIASEYHVDMANSKWTLRFHRWIRGLGKDSKEYVFVDICAVI